MWTSYIEKKMMIIWLISLFYIVFIEMIEIYGLSCYFDHKYDTTVAPPIWLTKSFPNFELS